MSEQGVTRRSALVAAAVGGVGVLGGYLAARNSAAAKPCNPTAAANAYGAGKPGRTPRRLAAVADVPAGGGVVLRDPAVVLTRTKDGTVHAFSAICTHQGCPVNRVSGGTIRCPCHNSHFDATTGRVTGGPAPRALPPVTVTVRDGGIFL